MSDLSAWQKGNDRHLTTSLTWLRMRLERLGQTDTAPNVLPFASSSSSPPPEPITPEDRSWMRWFFGKPSPRPATEPILELPTPAANEEKLAEAAAAREEAEKLDPPPALLILRQRFGLSLFEMELLLLCAAPELDTRIPALCAQAQGDPNLTYPTFALAFALFDDPAWDVISPERQLRYWKMLVIDQSNGQPIISCPLHLDQRIVDYIKGLNYLDVLLAPLTSPLDITLGETQLTPSQQAVANKIVDYMKQFSGSPCA
jgi:hypothetical protein